MSVKNLMRGLAATAGVLLVAGAAGPGAAAVTAEDSGDVQAVVRKTVRQAATATGEITNSTMYTQVSAVGNGTKTVVVPVGSTSNRNLNAFGPFPMEGESMVVGLTVADGGGTEERTVTDADIAPMEVSVKVMLDGVEIAPEDVVGANGVLDVEYTVRNTTATTGPVTFTDVEGKEITEDVETADPFVGSLDVVLPQGFNEVTAPGATVAGNGQNETQLGYTFVLFPPLGSTEVKVGYQSRISNGQMPAAEFSFLPIIPFENSTIAGTTEAYKGGAKTGAAIFGAGQGIGDNLLKLQDGAGKLVAGLGQLSAGATALNTGLDSAASGSQELADGSAQLSDGLNELDSSVPALSSGVKKLNSGAQQLDDGASELAKSEAAFSESLGLLTEGVDSLPESIQKDPGFKALKEALLGVQQAIGVKEFSADPTTLGQALYAIDLGLSNEKCNTSNPTDPTNPCGIKQVVGIVEGKLAGASAAGGPIGQLVQAATLAYTESKITNSTAAGGPPFAIGQPCPQNPGVPVPPVVPPTNLATAGLAANDVCLLISKIAYGLGLPASASNPDGGLQAQTAAAAAALGQVVKVIGDSTTDKTILNGLAQVWVGLTNPPPKCDPKNPKETKCGIKEIQGLVSGGIDLLVQGISDKLMQALGSYPPSPNCNPKATLNCASAALTAGAQQLAGGTDLLASGTKELNSKVPSLADGVNQLAAGGEQVAAGNEQLATGLTSAADGSGQLAEGLGSAEPGGAQIEDGAGRLKKEGADELAKTGKEAQLGYAKNVALLEAAQQAGLEGAGIPFGPAEGTDVVTTAAYKMYVAGIAADTENNALKYGLGALLIAGAGGAAFAASRKLAA